jgi:hypothetical protein
MAAFNITELSTGALTKSGGFLFHHTAEVTATVEGAGYYNSQLVCLFTLIPQGKSLSMAIRTTGRRLRWPPLLRMP